MPKRRKTDEDGDGNDTTPRKSRRTAKLQEDKPSSPSQPAETPTHRKSILKGSPSHVKGIKSVEATPSSLRKVLFSTPAQADGDQGAGGDTPIATRNDRSARRKSQRTLQKQTAGDEDSEGEQDAREEAIAQARLGEEDEEDEEEEDEITVDTSNAPDTPSKSGKPRGRPKGRRRERSPSPPPDLPPHELYFFQNRTGANKTSANTLPSHVLLNHEDYFAQMQDCEDPHAEDMERLKQLHMRAFDQWVFELEEGFNLCLYGYGSKRDLIMEFVEHVYMEAGQPPKIVVVNGYTPGLTIRDILTTIAGVVLPKSVTLPAQPQALLDLLLPALTKRVVLIIHSFDHSNLRKSATQSLLAHLVSHTSISLICSCDTLNFPLLWDTTLTSQFSFLFHDVTTFRPYTAEIEVVEDVNALLGRSSRRLGGKDGVGYVLKSLPENARNLFRVLVAEQLALADTNDDQVANGGIESDEDILGAEDEEEAANVETPSRRGRGRPAKAKAKKPSKSAAVQAPVGVEYRTLYHKAVEEFVCSSEVNFRTLLKEFHDHQMIESRKDALGTERLMVPFRREELETILEELV